MKVPDMCYADIIPHYFIANFLAMQRRIEYTNEGYVPTFEEVQYNVKHEIDMFYRAALVNKKWLPQKPDIHVQYNEVEGCKYFSGCAYAEYNDETYAATWICTVHHFWKFDQNVYEAVAAVQKRIIDEMQKDAPFLNIGDGI